MELLAWYDAHKRDVPWRRDTDPYRVMVSEFMLQQTRVETVLRYYEAWLDRFPTIESLAAATDDEVATAWSGLGYYRRARNLHAAAKHVAGAGWPENLRELPGVGEYTAGAIGSISFGHDVPAIDGNAERVYSRLHDIPLDVTTAAGKRAIREVAIPDEARPGDWNQAIMELGATICKPVPACNACPMADSCSAFAVGTAADRPVRPARRKPVKENVWFARVVAGGRVLLVKRDAGLLAGTWNLPGGSTDTPLEDHVAGAGVHVRVGDAVTIQHAFTHKTWHMAIHDVDILDVDHQAPAMKVQWASLDALDQVGLSVAAKKALNAGRA